MSDGSMAFHDHCNAAVFQDTIQSPIFIDSVHEAVLLTEISCD